MPIGSRTNDTSNGNSRSESRVGGGGAGVGGGGNQRSGPNYTFRNYRSNPNIRGNWNTGGDVVGFGSLDGGIRGVGQSRAPMGTPQPAASPIQPMVPPPLPPMVQAPVPQPGQVTDYFSQPVRMDPGILAQMLRGIKPQPAGGIPSTFPARPGATTRMGTADPSDNYGNDMFGNAYGGGNLGQRRGLGGGRNGGGFGGGGGGGW